MSSSLRAIHEHGGRSDLYLTMLMKAMIGVHVICMVSVLVSATREGMKRVWPTEKDPIDCLACFCSNQSLSPGLITHVRLYASKCC